MQLRSKTIRLLAAAMPLLALLADLLAALQGEAVWSYLALAALSAGALALLGDLKARSQPLAAALASCCLVASIGVRLAPPVPDELRLPLGIWLATVGVASLLLSGGLVEGLGRPETSLLAALELEAGDPDRDLPPSRLKRAS